MDSEILSWLLQQAPVVAVLGGGLWVVWRELKAEREYSRNLEKEVTQALHAMSSALEDVSDSVDDIKRDVADSKTSLDILRSK